MNRPGDLRELSIRREAIPDGVGGETAGLAFRVFVYDDEPENDLLAATLFLPEHQRAWTPIAQDLISQVSSIWELER